jgi:hypothetical protein
VETQVEIVSHRVNRASAARSALASRDRSAID